MITRRLEFRRFQQNVFFRFEATENIRLGILPLPISLFWLGIHDDVPNVPPVRLQFHKSRNGVLCYGPSDDNSAGRRCQEDSGRVDA